MKKGLLISSMVLVSLTAGSFIGSNHEVDAKGYPELLKQQGLLRSASTTQSAKITGVYHVDTLTKYNGKWYVVDNSIALQPVDYNNYIPVDPLVVTDAKGNKIADQTLKKGSYFTFGNGSFSIGVMNDSYVSLTINGEPVWFDRKALGSKLVVSGSGSTTPTNPGDTNLSAIKQAGINGFNNGSAGYPAGQCTSFVASILAHNGVTASKYQHLGNGADWAANAKAKGISVDMKPSAGSVVSYKGVGPLYPAVYGHVAYVTKVNSNGTYHVYEGNWLGASFHERDVSVDSTVAGFIHF